MARERSIFSKLFIVEDDKGAAPASKDLDAQISAMTNAVSSAPSDAPPVSPAVELTADSDLSFPEGVEFGTIYTEAGVPAATFPIEKLAKVVEGLNQLDPTTKKTAVAAMDAADDTWNITDVIADGNAKIAALRAYLGDINGCEAAINAEINDRVNANQERKTKRLEDIDAQIAKLTAEREAAITEASTQSTNLRAQGAAASEAAERERTRINAAIKGHEGLVVLFGVAAAPSSTPSNK